MLDRYKRFLIRRHIAEDFQCLVLPNDIRLLQQLDVPVDSRLVHNYLSQELMLRVNANPENRRSYLLILEQALLYFSSIELFILSSRAHCSQRQLHALGFFGLEVLLLSNEFSEFIADREQLLNSGALRGQFHLKLFSADIESVALIY